MITDLIFAIWIIFWLYWLISAVQTGSKNTYKIIGNTLWVRLLIFIAVVVVVRLSKGTSINFSNGSSLKHGLAIKIIGFIIFILSLCLAVWARLYLGNSWGMPMTKKIKTKLITSGPYKYIRHPIYSGILGATLGTALAVDWQWIYLLIVIGAYFFYSSVNEEKYMAQEFPGDYPKYKQHSKMFIPFIL